VQERVGTPGSRPVAESAAQGESERPSRHAELGQQSPQHPGDVVIETGAKSRSDRNESSQRVRSVGRDGRDAALDRDVGLADLLAEALMAFQDGHQDQIEQEDHRAGDEAASSRDKGSYAEKPPGSHATSHPGSSTEDDAPRARHRRPALDATADEWQSWIPRRY
jgi:hypothetical protein